jgi:hypothetical protein
MGVLDQGLFVNPPGNNWPLAAITAAQTRIEPGQCAKLDGSASIDPDGSPLTYRWSVSEAPLGAHPRIEGATESIARACPDSPGLYVVRLKVNDGLVDSVAAQVSIRAYHSDLDPDEGGGGPMNCAVGAGGGPGLLALMAALPVGLLIALRRRGLLA